jgi:uncharacterized surface protein with fasciclin (FAS1) repeats
MQRLSKTTIFLLAGTAALGSAGWAAAQTGTAPSAPAAQTAPMAPDQQSTPSAANATPSASTGTTALPPSAAAPNPMVGGAPMAATKTIVENAAAASNLSTLVSAVKAAGLDTTLAQPGPFTVFAPTNDAFSRLAPGTVDKLMKPENKATLTKVLTYHVVPGNVTIEDLQAKAAANGGTTTLTTVEGEPLKVAVQGQMISLTDVNGNKSYIETGDVRQANGIVHVVNGVVLPKLG